MDNILIYCTFGNEENAQSTAKALVEERLVACANILPTMRSFFHWDGAVQDEKEIAVIFKTTESHYDAVEKRIKELHTYDVPCIVVLPIQNGNPDFLNWISEQTRK